MKRLFLIRNFSLAEAQSDAEILLLLCAFARDFFASLQVHFLCFFLKLIKHFITSFLTVLFFLIFKG